MPDVINRLFDLYIIQNNHYLIQFEGGNYRTFTEKDGPLRRYHLDAHLKGKKTVGTFGGKFFTKFMTFDVDFKDTAAAKWVTYKLAEALNTAGVRDYVISFSGNKGYHVDIFFNKAVSIDSTRKFFDFIIKAADLRSVQGGEIEYRPSGSQGVKLPIGTHQKTDNYCGFCLVEDGLRVMGPEESTEYLHLIKKTDSALILDIINGSDEEVYDLDDAAEMETVISRHKMLDTYEQTESYTLSRAAERYHNGLTGPGQRHKSFLMLARLFNHNGVERDEAVCAITEWFSWQDTAFYESDAEFCAKDLRECVDYIYTNNLTLTVEQRDITVKFNEVDEILRQCSSMNHKALAYAMLVHSKRWAGDSGAFYMTYKQIKQTTGLDRATAWRNIAKLEDIGIIQVVQRDQKVRGTHIKKPNVYRMNLQSSDEGAAEFNVNAETGLTDCLLYFYDAAQLKKLLPRRQYASLAS